MKSIYKLVSVSGLAGALMLGGCADMNPPANQYGSGQYGSGAGYPQQYSNSGGSYAGYGVVQSIELVRQGASGIGGSGIGAGAIAGAVIGGIVGHQVGQGQGNTAATVLGAAGGAYAGNELEKRNQQQQADAYKFTIRMQDGSYQTVLQSSNPDIRVGDRVRINNGVAQRY
jgi:outer membrane lipoprotein SlyB